MICLCKILLQILEKETRFANNKILMLILTELRLFEFMKPHFERDIDFELHSDDTLAFNQIA